MLEPSTTPAAVPPVSLSAERQRLLALRLASAAQTAVPSARIPKRSDNDSLPLSPGQRQLWIVDRMSPGNPAYNLAIAYRITGTLDRAALTASFDCIIARHESLRTTFHESDGESVQRVHQPWRIAIEHLALAPFPAAEREVELSARMAAAAVQPFDLSQLPLLRISLFRLAEEEHVLLIHLHHIIFDVWSFAIFARELSAHYAAGGKAGTTLPPLPVQYPDYALWRREKDGAPAMETQLTYWRKQLGGERAPLPVPAGRPRPARQSWRGGSAQRDLPHALAESLRDLARAEGVTLFMLTLAAFKALLALYSGESDLCIGSPIAQRPNVETEALIGYFLNMLALRSDFSGDPDFREILRRERASVLDAFQNQDVPYARIVSELHPSRNLSHQPIFQIAFVLVPTDSTLPVFGDATVIPQAVPVSTAKFDLTLFIGETPTGMRTTLEFSEDQFDASTAGRMLESFDLLLHGVVANPGTRLSRLPILSAPDRERILGIWSGSERPFPHAQTVAERFAEIVARVPAAIAVIDGADQITYANLEVRANRVAHFLQSRGIRAGGFVGLRAERSLSFVVKILGIVKAGAAYLPLDESEPPARLAAMKASCALILDAECDKTFPVTPVRSTASADGAAYVLYTSGSTGVPKGVVVPHRGIMRLVVNNDYAPFQPGDVVAFASNVCFDAATFEMWGALLNGAALVVLPRDVLLSPGALAAHLAQHRVTVLFLTTSLFNRLAHDAPAMFRDLRIVVFGGEAADAESVRLVLAHGRPQRLVNGYGPTETTTFAICHTIEKLDRTTVPIGRPVANTRVFLLDESRQPVPVGVAAEILIGGPGVALGYHDAPELTAEKFPETPFGRLYRTGDLGRWLPDGTIEYLGRRDQQLKLRGFRIEPGELETALQQHPAVQHAAIVVHAEGGVAQSLIAYLVPRSADKIEAAALREFLSARVPQYMIPAAFVWLDSLPLTANGKLDTRNLPPPDFGACKANTVLIVPRNETEAALAAIWNEILQRTSSSVLDDFFTLGGHSLLALKMLSTIRRELDVEIPARRLFETPTIEGLARFITERPASAPAGNFLVPVQRGDAGKRPLFLVPGGWGGEIEFLVYGELSRQMDPARPIWGLKARGAGTAETPHASVTEMAADYVREIRRIQPRGPYLLAGECVGGICAQEMAVQLEKAGEDVALLVLLDTVVPSPSHLTKYLDAETRKADAEAERFTFTRRVGHHLEKMSQLSMRGKFGYLFDKALHRAAAAAPDSAAASPQHPRGQKDYPVTLFRHRPQSFGGTVTLLIDAESAAVYGNLGWENVALGKLDTHVLPGTHLTYIRENAADAAAKLRELLSQADTIFHHAPAAS